MGKNFIGLLLFGGVIILAMISAGPIATMANPNINTTVL
jgi:hypothetical protein